MRKSQRSFIFDLSVFLGSLVVLAYFGWHGFYGPRSYTHGKKIHAKVAVYQAELDKVTRLRDRRNKKVSLLRPRTIDPDMLDEMARKVLGFAGKQDVIVLESSN